MHPSKFAPPTGSAVLERERLLDRLASWEDRRLVLITGPAGQGKTTLAAAYTRTLSSPCIWFTLDETDDDPGVFLERIGRAICRTYPKKGDAPSSVPLDRYPSAAGIPAIAKWARAVFAGIENALIIIDEFRSYAVPCPLVRLIDALIAAAPPKVRFLILSRSRPSLEISRLRAQRAVAEIRSGDLRFTDAEAAELYRTVFRMSVSTDDIIRLNTVTEGWAAGLVLMHEYLASSQSSLADLTLPGSRNAGYREHVFDYLAHAVFSHLPVDLQDFLLRTSVTEHLTLPLAAALTGLPVGPPGRRGTVAALVQELQRRNLFVSMVDADEPSVRYHALFREYLVKQLLVSSPASSVRRRYETAAGHLLRAGDPVRAIELYLTSGHLTRAVPLMERTGKDLVARGRTRTLARLLDTLPPDQRERPWMLFFRAVPLRFKDPRSALRLHERAYAAFAATGDREGQILTLCGIIEACFHSGGDFHRMELAASRAKRLVHARKRVTRNTHARLLQAIGIASFFTGRLDRGIESLREAMGQFRSAGDHFHEVSCAVYLAPCALYHGDFVLAQQIVHRGFEVQRTIPEDPGGEAALHLTQAMVSLFVGDISEADAAVAECRRLVRENGLEAIGLLLLNVGGWVAFAQGDLRSAEVQLTDCLGRAERLGNRFFSSSASHLLAMVYLFQHRLDRAKLMADRSLCFTVSEQSRLFRGIYLIMRGAVAGAQGRTRLAQHDLREALSLLRSCHSFQQEVNARLMLARIMNGQSDAADRRAHLRDAFTLGRERGFTYYAPFTEEQLGMLTDEAIAHGICVDYCRSLRDRISGPGAIPTLRVFCLGGFRVERNGNAIPDAKWKSKRAKTLLKLLAVRSGNSLSRDAVIDLLWPDAPVERHSALLSNLLHRLRNVLDAPGRSSRGASCVLQNGDVLMLDRKKVWTDVGTFLSQVQRARQLRTAGEDHASVLKAHVKAIEQYSGDLLPTDLYDEWIAPERERLRRQYTEMLDTAAELSEAAGERDRSRVLYERMFSFDPCHDHACRWLMTRHMAEGHRQKAVRVYEQHELAVRHELDINPDEQTRMLYRRIIGE